MKISKLLILPFSFLAAVLILPGCAGVMQQVSEMLALTKCQFRLASVSDVQLAGIPLQGDNVRIGPANLLRLQGALTRGALPLGLTVNVEAKNPNTTQAGMSRMEWIMLMDGNEITRGVLEKSVVIAPNNGVGNFPLEVEVDLKTLLSGKPLDSMVNLAKNIAGEGDRPTRLTLKVKPSIRVGEQMIPYPDYVTVTHEFKAN